MGPPQNRRFYGETGAGCVNHGVRNRSEIDKYGKSAGDKTIGQAVEQSRVR